MEDLDSRGCETLGSSKWLFWTSIVTYNELRTWLSLEEEFDKINILIFMYFLSPNLSRSLIS